MILRYIDRENQAILCPLGMGIYVEHQKKVRYADGEGKIV
jgi:hypothetical protein